jgi:thiamine transport system substrate-binding protein
MHALQTKRRNLRWALRPLTMLAATTALALVAVGCSNHSDPAGSNSSTDPTIPSTVKLVTHGCFALAEDVKAKFTATTGLALEIISADDAGAMLNQLILTKDAPIGDAVFGIDNAFASRAIVEGILDPYASPAAGAEQMTYAPEVSPLLTAIDFSDVCLNVDLRVLPNGAALTFDDLLDPAYRDLLVVENPATSSPGLAFLLATFAAKGEDDWLAYWQALKANGLLVVSGWEEAYYSEFSGASGSGSRPIVVSYASSPPSTVDAATGQPITAAALATCFRQVEFAGVLKGASNPQGAQRLIDFLLSQQVQADLPTSMWMYPVKDGISLPDDWAQWAPLADEPWLLSAIAIGSQRESLLEMFNDNILG